MEFKVRATSRQDAEKMLQLYNSFTRGFVGSAARIPKSFTRMLQKRDNINYVALDGRDQIVGYVHATLEKRNRTGEFREIIVDPRHDFEEVASLLIDQVNADFKGKKAAAIIAASLRNPAYEKIFPKLGFMESESMGVFMYAVLDTQKLLDELQPVFAARLKRADGWNGLAQIQCGEHSLFLEKTTEEVQPIVWTNQPVDFKVELSVTILVKLIFGVADALECCRNGQLKMETPAGEAKAIKLLERLFPKSQFLTMDYW
jgi:N-acetylglutamate synthase-like GNAT family acetyltransferase